MKYIQMDHSAYERAPALAELLSQGGTPVSENEAIGMLANLFRGVLAHSHHSDKKPSGVIGGPARLKLVAAWCKWRGDPVFLCEILEVLGFLEAVDQQKLRVRGMSRYWPTMQKNSRPNSKTRAKLKREREEKEARAGQARANDGPQAGFGRAFTSTSTYKKEGTNPDVPTSSNGGGFLKPVPPDFLNPPPPEPSVLDTKREGCGKPSAAKKREGEAAFVSGSWRDLELTGPLELDFLLGWWEAARVAVPGLGADRGTKRLPELWEAVRNDGYAENRLLWAGWTYLTEQGVTAVKAETRPLAVLLGPSVYAQRAPKEKPHVAPPPPTCEAPGCERTEVFRCGDKLLCYEQHGPEWAAEYDKQRGREPTFASA